MFHQVSTKEITRAKHTKKTYKKRKSTSKKNSSFGKYCSNHLLLFFAFTLSLQITSKKKKYFDNLFTLFSFQKEKKKETSQKTLFVDEKKKKNSTTMAATMESVFFFSSFVCVCVFFEVNSFCFYSFLK